MEWEYKTLDDRKINSKELLTEELNKLGSDGWEVVNYSETPPPRFGGEWKFSVLLKRQKQSNESKQLLVD